MSRHEYRRNAQFGTKRMKFKRYTSVKVTIAHQNNAKPKKRTWDIWPKPDEC